MDGPPRVTGAGRRASRGRCGRRYARSQRRPASVLIRLRRSDMSSPASPTPAPRRSCLSGPGASAAMLAKAASRGADEIVIDLEDAVAIGAKEEARETVVAALAEPQWRGVRTSVRVNAPRTPWCHLDVMALAALPDAPETIVVPKVESPADMAFVERLL